MKPAPSSASSWRHHLEIWAWHPKIIPIPNTASGKVVPFYLARDAILNAMHPRTIFHGLDEILCLHFLSHSPCSNVHHFYPCVITHHSITVGEVLVSKYQHRQLLASWMATCCTPERNYYHSQQYFKGKQQCSYAPSSSPLKTTNCARNSGHSAVKGKK